MNLTLLKTAPRDDRGAAAYTVTNTPGPRTKVFCTEYQLDGITLPVTLGLEFIDDTLEGYILVVPRKEANAFGEALIDKFSDPRATGPTRSWMWPSGTGAIYDAPLIGNATLVVATKLSLARAAADAKQLREQIKKGF